MKVLLISQYDYEINHNILPHDPLLIIHYKNYHKKVYDTLLKLNHHVTVSSGLETNILDLISNSDVVFSLRHDYGFRNSDLYISLMCDMENTKFIGNSTFSKFYDSDKIVGKLLAEKMGIQTPLYCFHYNLTNIPFTGPYLIKPRFGASSTNISDWNICKNEKDLVKKYNTLQNPENFFIEKYIEGTTLTIGCVKGLNNEYWVGQPYLLFSKNHRIISYEDKRNGSCLRKTAKENHLGLKSLIKQYFTFIQPCPIARFDFIQNKQGELFFLEVNTTPNLSCTGSLFNGLEKIMGSYENFINHLISLSSSSNK